MNFRRTLTVFMGSPGGLSDERDAVQATIDEMNRLFANRAGYQLDLIRWEDSVPGFGNPQERLNLELDRADLFIGMLNRHWGSPPEGESEATSGFEEEYRRSLARRQATGSPEMMVLFQKVPDEILRDAGPHLQKVIAFRQELDHLKPIFYKTFDGVADLQQQLRAYLSAWLHGLREAETQAGRDDLAEPPAPNSPTNDGEQLIFSPQGAAFLADIAKGGRESGALAPPEIARLRLLGLLSHTSGNDPRALGVHDANLLYSDYSPDVFGPDEVGGLISSALEHYKAKTVPLWTWLMQRGAPLGHTLANATLLQLRTVERVGALAALQFIGFNLESPSFDRGTFVQLLLDGSENRDVRSATLQYLNEHGLEADLPELWTAHASAAAGQIEEVAIAILHILARTDPTAAFRNLIDLGPSSPSRALVDQIFTTANAVPEAWLIEAFAHRSAPVRASALAASARLGAERLHWARALTRDEDADVRAAAVGALEASGELLSPEDVRSILVRSTKNALWPFGIPSRSSGSAQWAFYRRHSLRRWSDEQKRLVAERDQDAVAMLQLAGADQNIDLLRALVDQKGTVDINTEWPRPGQDPSPLTEDRALSLYARAAECLATKMEASDIERIRGVFADTRVDLSESVYRYLGAHGDWTDVARVVAATNERRGTAPPTMLSIPNRSSEYRWASEALIALGDSAWDRILTLSPEPAVLRRLVLTVPQRAWTLLSDHLLIGLFTNGSEEVREVAALRCIRDLPAKRIRALAGQFQALSENRFYSIIHWLDFGMAVPRTISVPAARRWLDLRR